MKIKLIVVGKIKEKYWTDAISEYSKRLNAFCELNLVEVKEVNTDDINKNIEEEAKNIISCIKDEDYVITLEILGKEYSSEELAFFIKNHYTYDNKVLTFIIGALVVSLLKAVIKVNDVINKLN